MQGEGKNISECHPSIVDNWGERLNFFYDCPKGKECSVDCVVGGVVQGEKLI